MNTILTWRWRRFWAAGVAILVAASLNAAPDADKAKEDAAKDTPSSGTKPTVEKPAAEKPATAKVEAAPAVKPIELSKDLKKLAENLWIDAKNRWVVIDAKVVLRRGPPLEMFACLKNTKEHESIIAADVKAFQVHGALLAIGAKQGTPVQFQPTYKSATGDVIEVRILWKDEKGKEHQIRAQDWIRDIKTKKSMPHQFVFAGSGFWTDEETGQKHYMAEGGELICVSNFPSATLDLPVESSQSTESLQFEAFSERIPPEETAVRMVLMPQRAEKDAKDAKGSMEPSVKGGESKPAVGDATGNKKPS